MAQRVGYRTVELLMSIPNEQPLMCSNKIRTMRTDPLRIQCAFASC